MSKKYANTNTTTLVIVESPAKCKKIEEYLGPGYKCMASFGHLRELPSLKNINIENHFAPTYCSISNQIKQRQIALLKKAVYDANDVIIASDNDREGESIGWHFCDMFKLNVEKTKRIVFNEITESAIQHAIRNPTRINMDIVHAQQARQILDLLVGFKISPVLWKYISRNSESALSAGRCQTPALKLIYDNQQEIDKCENKQIYNTTGYFTNKCIPFELNKNHESKDDMVDFLSSAADYQHIYNCSQPTKTYKSQPDPFTTSRIQQVASNEFHYSPKETMKLCQTLYEGGYITYMRTDSKTYSSEFLDTAFEYICSNYNKTYVHENPSTIMSGSKLEAPTEIESNTNIKPKKGSKRANTNEGSNPSLAQEAHEAIRPTKISLTSLPEECGVKEKRMYKLIWENTLESCMSKASFYSVTATIQTCDGLQFKHTSEMIDFPGWKIVKKDYEKEKHNYYQYLQTMKAQQVVPYKKIVSKVTIKNTKLHYTEARLVQLLEEKGIGRPSTYSMLVDKIQERGYVKKEDVKGKMVDCCDYELEDNEISEIETQREFGNEKNKLVIQPLGILVIEFLAKYFNDLFNYEYTRQMEDDLDKISKGSKIWYELCDECNNQIVSLIDNLSEKNESKLEIQIDECHSYIIGKYGPVIKCVEMVDGKKSITFKPVKKNVDVHKLENGEYTLEDVLATNVDDCEFENPSMKSNVIANSNICLGKYEDVDLYLKKGKFGLYAAWGTQTKSLKEFGNRPIESIRLEEVLGVLSEGSSVIRKLNDNISIRKGPKGDYVFFKTSKMKKPRFFGLKGFDEDYVNCEIQLLLSWIKENHGVY